VVVFAFELTMRGCFRVTRLLIAATSKMVRGSAVQKFGCYLMNSFDPSEMVL